MNTCGLRSISLQFIFVCMCCASRCVQMDRRPPNPCHSPAPSVTPLLPPGLGACVCALRPWHPHPHRPRSVRQRGHQLHRRILGHSGGCGSDGGRTFPQQWHWLQAVPGWRGACTWLVCIGEDNTKVWRGALTVSSCTSHSQLDSALMCCVGYVLVSPWLQDVALVRATIVDACTLLSHSRAAFGACGGACGH
jgi:hypothetical protein